MLQKLVLQNSTSCVQTQLVPCDKKGREYTEDDETWVDNPRDLVGKDLHCVLKIHSARGVPSRFTVSCDVELCVLLSARFHECNLQTCLEQYVALGIARNQSRVRQDACMINDSIVSLSVCGPPSRCTWRTRAAQSPSTAPQIRTGTSPISSTSHLSRPRQAEFFVLLQQGAP